jgi:hypothetical protein
MDFVLNQAHNSSS